MAERMSIEKWDRFFALYDGDQLVCVTVYKKGALEVKRRLEELRERGTDGEVSKSVGISDAECRVFPTLYSGKE